ncbi:MAG: bile acid:sodium symporter family protein [Shimia sp.]
MDILLNVVLPLSLAFIMFSLGTGLTLADFGRVVTQPKGFALGAVAQVLLLPLAAFALLQVFPLEAALATGVMILAACPGGVTSNILTRLARGAVALSVTLTAVISLASVVIVPAIVVFSVGYFMGDAAPEVSVASIAVTMFAITAVPVGLGVLLRRLAPAFTTGAEPWLFRIATVLFVVIVAAALAANWETFITNLPTLGPVLILLNIVMLVVGVLLGRLGGLAGPDAKAIAIEAGVQNGTLGIAVGSLIEGQAFGPLSLASGVYGITMYLVTIPAIFLILRRLR